MPVDSNTFRAALSRFATGITVVTTCRGTERLGITVNAFCSVSLDPPLVLACVDQSSRVHEALLESRIFAVNFLTEKQEDISTCFAGNSDFRYQEFCGVASHSVVTGAPVFDMSLAYVDCTLVDTYPGGDHTIFVGHVEAAGVGDGLPLLYYRSAYVHPSESEH